jgi:Domain of unknown function (DUF4126)
MLWASTLAAPSGTELTALLVVVCFSAGLNIYATVAMLGLLSHARVLALPPELQLVDNWYVIGMCAVLFLIEFVGDKIPIFDLFWNALHTFVRVPVAGLLTYGATAQLPEWERLVATLAGSLIALAAHSGKTAARAAVSHSPEPFSNIALSLGEDGLVVFLIWFATRHPYQAAGIALVGLAVIAVMIRAVVGAMRTVFGGGEDTFKRMPAPAKERARND